MLRSRVLTDFLMYYDEESYKFESFLLDKQKIHVYLKWILSPYSLPEKLHMKFPKKQDQNTPQKRFSAQNLKWNNVICADKVVTAFYGIYNNNSKYTHKS